RFTATYRISGDEKTARGKAADICAEQTVEFPVALLPDGIIPQQIVGQIESFEREADTDNSYIAVISFAEELAAGEHTQFLNVLFGNISMKAGIQLIAVQPSEGLFQFLKGPRFGIEGIRRIVGVPHRPLLFTALKPMGLSAKNLAALAGTFADGGIDIIKDDHGISNQPFSPFAERVKYCTEAVRQSNAKSNRSAIYVPNVSAPHEQVFGRGQLAKELGAGALMISPGLTGIDVIGLLADKTGLPVFAHPAFLGGMAITAGQGCSCAVLYGTLLRLAGADATIFPNFGGRFPLTQQDCSGIVAASREPLGDLKPMFPSPAGGMELKNLPAMLNNYGNDVLVLIGSGLFSAGGNLLDNCKKFVEAVQNQK
ncbi:MAG: RuBisCO large subunit C-terminal-like domain-containing protein, partial [Planctomycetaceae bacterium]|nr:RuBisCO large subunit C-terminal-like domain-containing protein [Planctomycetaceae bacterium]